MSILCGAGGLRTRCEEHHRGGIEGKIIALVDIGATSLDVTVLRDGNQIYAASNPSAATSSPRTSPASTA